MKRAIAAAALAFAGIALAQPADIAAFSTAAPGGALPAGWRERGVGRVPPAQITLVADGATVLQVKSHAAAGAATHALRVDPSSRPVLAWRWKVDRVVEAANLERRSGDDFAARVYVFFDVPEGSLPFVARMKLRLARLLYGEELPTAGICYVWDNRHAAGTTAWSAYTDRIRIVVAESGSARAGEWVDARRDLEADFRAAFGSQWPGAVPRITGVALGNDTDQTGETATALFGDVRLEARR